MIRGEIFILRGIAKKIVPKKTLKKIKKIKNKAEKIELYKHAIKINLEKRVDSIEEKIKKHEKNHDIFHLFTKAKLLNLKIKYFYITHNKKDLKISLNLLHSIENELFGLEKKGLKKEALVIK